MKKRSLSFVLMLALVVAAAINPMLSYATEATTGTPTEMAIDDYRKDKDADGNYTEVPTAPTGYVFGGWYTTATCDEPIAANKTTGNAFAKWVPNNVLSVKYQITASTTINDTTTNLRLVTTVDSVNYSKVGFVLNNGERDSKPAMANTVYEKIRGIVNGVPTDFEPETTFGAPAEFFMVYEVAVPNSAFTTNFTVTPRWITLDGTLVEGVDNDFKIDDVAIRLIEQGVTFEAESHMNWVVAGPPSGYSRFHQTQMAIVEREGSNVLAVNGVNLDADGSTYPNITIKLGEVYLAGSKFMFDGCFTGGRNTTMRIREYKNGVQVAQQDVFIQTQYEYNDKTIALQSDCDSLVVFLTAKSSEEIMYYDNFKLIPAVNLETGLTFEKAYHLNCITAGPPSGYSSYHQTEMAIVERNGSNMLAANGVNLDADGGTYPNITVNFGKVYEAGSVLTFYTYYGGSNNSSMMIREYKDGAQVAQQTTWIQSQFEYTGEKLKTITLQSDCDSVVLFLTAKSAENTIYYDDIKITPASE